MISPEFKKSSGFTLVELIVSMAISGILLLGISVFFSSSFQSLFKSQSDSVNMQNHFAVNKIIGGKFNNLKKIINQFSVNSATKLAFLVSDSNGRLPFSYIGTDSDKHLVLKDFLVFNKIYNESGTDFYADSGSGTIRNAGSGIERIPKINPPSSFKNFSSFEIIGTDYYVVFPDKNSVMKCPCGTDSCEYSSCQELAGLPALFSPTDIVKSSDGKYLFISDSGNGKIIKYDVDNGKEADAPWSPVASGMKYPTGLAYYKEGLTEWLFVAETLGNKIRKINLSSPSLIDTIAGDGDDTECMNTAKFCKLNMPTGLNVNKDEKALYVSDSGNNRIIKIKDPSELQSLIFKFNMESNYALDMIEFVNSSWGGNGTYDHANSSLFGDKESFSNKIKITSRFTTYEGATKCQSSPGEFYVNEDSILHLKSGDKIIINGTAYTIKDPTLQATDCTEPPPALTMNKWKVSIQESATIPSGQDVYLSNPIGEITVKIDGLGSPNKINFDESGFQPFEIKIYDIFKGHVQTDYSTVRVGDGSLGTSEDQVEVVKNNIQFPTGVSASYYAISGDLPNLTKVRKTDDSGEQILEAVDTESFSQFDYVSDFILSSENPLRFSLLNSGGLLEMTMNAIMSEDKIQTYTLNANIPK